MNSLYTASSELSLRFQNVRSLSHEICTPLAIEDYGLQAVAETSPIKWHLAHTTWFFETFVLAPFAKDYRPFAPQYEVLFNSYYNGVGAQFPRTQRHILSRPTVSEVLDYRAYVDAHMLDLLQQPPAQVEEIGRRVELGLHHEQQHQELMLTDLKYNFAQNPLFPTYRAASSPPHPAFAPLRFVPQPEREVWVGQGPADGFSFDNETPRHRMLVLPFSIANRLITNGEYLEFIEDGGYERAELWLADGWTHIQSHRWRHPQQWTQCNHEYREFTLHGLQPLAAHLPVTHVSYYEADAFARWHGSRLCTEFEWEAVASTLPCHGDTLDMSWLHPSPAAAETPGLQQLFGTAWEWTQSAYLPHPGFQAAKGALGEYNGKFMCNQMVLRGGSCVTPNGHVRASYRNFFYPQDRWQFTGIRLARNF